MDSAGVFATSVGARKLAAFFELIGQVCWRTLSLENAFSLLNRRCI